MKFRNHHIWALATGRLDQTFILNPGETADLTLPEGWEQDPRWSWVRKQCEQGWLQPEDPPCG